MFRALTSAFVKFNDPRAKHDFFTAQAPARIFVRWLLSRSDESSMTYRREAVPDQFGHNFGEIRRADKSAMTSALAGQKCHRAGAPDLFLKGDFEGSK